MPFTEQKNRFKRSLLLFCRYFEKKVIAHTKQDAHNHPTTYFREAFGIKNETESGENSGESLK